MGTRQHENLNGLLRQYQPKGLCMRDVTQARCDHIADAEQPTTKAIRI